MFINPLTGSIRMPLIIGLVAVAFLAGGFGGWTLTSDHYQASMLKAERNAHKLYHDEVIRGDNFSARLAIAEQTIHSQSTEILKNVPKVTTGTVSCLNADAIRLLNTGNSDAPKATGQPAAENASTAAAPEGNTASDRDVAYWIEQAKTLYATCAARLNGLVDYENGRPSGSD